VTAVKGSTEAAKAAIIQLMEDETVAFLARDYEAWAKYWVHEPYVRFLAFTGPGGVIQRTGWEEYSARMKRYMAAYPTPSTVKLHREAMNIRVGKDMAWATFDQVSSGGSGAEGDLPERTHEVWAMEKRAEGWKIACLCVVVQSLEHIADALIRVDRDAAVAWMNSAAEQELRALRSIAVRAGRLRAADRAVDQRLQAAIRWAGSLGDHVWTRHGTLPVVVDGGEGEPANVCWVIAHNSEIFVAINNRRMTEDRLTAAAAVYGITPAQVRLAGLIIAGHDLVVAAERLGVSVNTTRTQLQRMFEKTGVRSQSALVRALLSVAAPLA
jgi:DNA-binding CsgD family transcriptional regulator